MKVITRKALPSITTLTEALDFLFSIVSQTESSQDSQVLWKIEEPAQTTSICDILLLAYKQITDREIEAEWLNGLVEQYSFADSEILHPEKVGMIESHLHLQAGYDNRLNTAVTYLLDELFCNIQQHSMCHQCLVYAGMNTDANCIDICVSDNGISLYGSYIRSGRYSEQLDLDSISALHLAKDGFSTKNRPDAENRGYGISSNLKMVIEGLKGSFAIISGNALYLHSGQQQLIVGLPKQIEWQGTTVIARIPNKMPSAFSIYDYIS